MILERGGAVAEPQPLLDRHVAAPVRDFHVALQQAAVGEGFGEVVADAGFLQGAGGDGAVGAIGVACALLLGVFFAFGVEGFGEGGCVWDVGCGEFEFGFLFFCGVGGGAVGGEGVEDVLFVVLAYLSWERGEG